MYHNNCMDKYISKFQQDVKKLLADDFENLEKGGSLDIGRNGHAPSDVQDMLNKKLKCDGKA